MFICQYKILGLQSSPGEDVCICQYKTLRLQSSIGEDVCICQYKTLGLQPSIPCFKCCICACIYVIVCFKSFM